MSKLTAAREQLPVAALRLAQLAADNPGQMALLLSGAYLAGGVAVRVVRPRGPLEALALVLVLNTAIGYAVPKLVESGVIKLKVRDLGLVFCGDDCPGHTTGMPGKSCMGVRSPSAASRADPAT